MFFLVKSEHKRSLFLKRVNINDKKRTSFKGSRRIVVFEISKRVNEIEKKIQEKKKRN